MTTLLPDPVYIAAPFAPCFGMTEDLNARRAEALHRLALASGLAPITPHPAMLRIELDETLRHAQASANMRLLSLAARSMLPARLWVLLQPDGEPATSTALEVVAWKRMTSPANHRIRRGRWLQWEQAFRSAGMVDLHTELCANEDLNHQARMDRRLAKCST